MISNVIGADASILLTERSRIVGVWFAHGNTCDWMACVWRDDPRRDWTCRARVRLVVDDELWPSKDKKRWTTGLIPGVTPEPEIISGMARVADAMAETLGLPKENVSRIIIRGGVEEFIDTLQRPEYASFAHSLGLITV